MRTRKQHFKMPIIAMAILVVVPQITLANSTTARSDLRELKGEMVWLPCTWEKTVISIGRTDSELYGLELFRTSSHIKCLPETQGYRVTIGNVPTDKISYDLPGGAIGDDLIDRGPCTWHIVRPKWAAEDMFISTLDRTECHLDAESYYSSFNINRVPCLWKTKEENGYRATLCVPESNNTQRMEACTWHTKVTIVEDERIMSLFGSQSVLCVPDSEAPLLQKSH